MKLGIFVNQEHINFIPFISILTAQTADIENINIHVINHKSKIKDFNFYDMNLVLNRYCLIRFDKLLNKKYLNKIFSLSIPAFRSKKKGDIHQLRSQLSASAVSG